MLVDPSDVADIAALIPTTRRLLLGNAPGGPGRALGRSTDQRRRLFLVAQQHNELIADHATALRFVNSPVPRWEASGGCF